MKKRVGLAYLLVPVLYIAIIFGLLFLQFSSGQRFREMRGKLHVTGTMRATEAGGDEQILRITLNYFGIEFPFGDENPMVLVDEDGNRTPVAITGYSELESGFELQFERDISVRFILDGGSRRELQVKPRLPQELLPTASVELPYHISQDAERAESNPEGVLSVRHEQKTYYLAPPPRSKINARKSLLRLPGDIAEQTIRYTEVADEEEAVVTRWFSDDQLAIPDDEYRELLMGYIDKAYRGWADERYNGGSGTWDMQQGSARFEEKILTAYLTEAWARDEFDPAVTTMRRAADLHAQQVGLRSSAFLGDLRNVREKVIREDETKTQELLELARAENPELFRTPHLIAFAADRGSQELLQAVLDYADRANYRASNMMQAIGMLRSYVEARQVNRDLQNRLSQFRGIVEERILPELVHLDPGFFVRTGPGQVDVYHSVLAGSLLTTLADQEGDPRLRRIGRNLIRSAFRFSNDTGFLPRVLFTGDGNLQGSEGALGPAAIYDLITPRPHYPRQLSLYDEIGPGAWIWSAVEFTDIQIGNAQYRFTLRNVPNRTHYLFLQGIPPFNGMQLFGQPWRNDPSFESYVKGRHYNRDSRTLMIKYTDDAPSGDIVLSY